MEDGQMCEGLHLEVKPSCSLAKGLLFRQSEQEKLDRVRVLITMQNEKEPLKEWPISKPWDHHKALTCRVCKEALSIHKIDGNQHRQ